MKQQIIKALVLIGAPFLLLAGKGHAQQSTALEDFTGILANGNCVIELYQADRNSIYVDDNEKAKTVNLKIFVENGTLHIDNHAGDLIKSNIRVHIKVYFKKLNALDLSGATDVTSNDVVQTSRMYVKSIGAVHLNLKVVADEVKVNADGASDITLAGKSKSLSADVKGATNLKAGDLTAQTVTIIADGGSSAKVNVIETINVKADGASSVRYTGEPTSRKIIANGAASVKKAL